MARRDLYKRQAARIAPPFVCIATLVIDLIRGKGKPQLKKDTDPRLCLSQLQSSL
jgi:hypothetical protein